MLNVLTTCVHSYAMHYPAPNLNTHLQVSSKEWGAAVSQNKEMLAKWFGGASVGEIGTPTKRTRIKQLCNVLPVPDEGPNASGLS